MADEATKKGHSGAEGAVPPGSVDRTGRRDHRPTWTPLVVYAICAVLVCLVGFRWVRTVSDGLLLIIVVAGITVALIILATARLVGYVSRGDYGVLTEEERAALEADERGAEESPLARQAQLVLLLGTRLGRPAREWHVDGTGTSLEARDLQALEDNRVAEAKRTAAWLATQHDVEQVEMTAPDGIVLSGHVFHVDRTSNRWVILAHGYRGHWTEMLMYARNYAARGFNLLIPELRGHRESGGRYLGLGYLDGSDLIAWSRWIAHEVDEGARIVLHGHCMGAAAVCIAAGDKTLPSGVVAGVADCAYSDAWNVAKRIVRSRGVPAHPGLDFGRFGFSLMNSGYDIALASPVEAVSHAQVPMLYMQGELDPFVPPYMAKRLYDRTSGSAAGDNHKLCMFPRAGHCESSLSDPRRYWHEVFAFVERRCVQGMAEPLTHRG